MAGVVLASGCVVHEYREPPPPPVAYRSPPPPPPPPLVQPDVDVASVVIEPPVDQPPAVAIPYAPPPMRWDPPPPQPYAEAVWVGGHWSWWNGEWVWARGHWSRPPNPGYVYCEPYYEYRGPNVVFVAGFWRPVARVFVPPPPTVYVPVAEVRVVHVGYARPVGPQGVFVPAPPGSQPGVIVPAPIGTPPAVVLSAPPVVRPGMVIRPAPRGGVVEVVAPAGVTREGRPVAAEAPVVSRDAAAVHPVVVAPPPPVRGTPVNAGYDRGHGGAVPYGPDANAPVIRRPDPNGSGVTVQPRPPPTPIVGQPSSVNPAGGPPLVQPELKPEAMGGQRGNPNPRPGANAPGDEPILRPVPRTESTPNGPVVQNEGVSRPAASNAPPRAQAAAPRPKAHPAKVPPGEKKKQHDEPRER